MTESLSEYFVCFWHATQEGDVSQIRKLSSKVDASFIPAEKVTKLTAQINLEVTSFTYKVK